MKELFLKGSVEELPELAAAVEEEGRALSAALRAAAQLVLEELYVNVCLYAYDGAPGAVRLRLTAGADALRCELEDHGRPFNPLEQEAPDPAARFAAGDFGGAGLVLVRAKARDMRYERTDGRNLLSFSVGERP